MNDHARQRAVPPEVMFDISEARRLQCIEAVLRPLADGMAWHHQAIGLAYGLAKGSTRHVLVDYWERLAERADSWYIRRVVAGMEEA